MFDVKSYALTDVYYPQSPLLTEGLNAKDIVLDIVQVAVSSGAVIGTGGAGGDVVTDALFAIEIANSVLEEVTEILGELQEIGSIIHASVKLDFAGNPDSFYDDVSGLLKKVLSSSLVGDEVEDFLESIRGTVSDVIGRLVRAISKWVAALLPDDFGLSGPAFEAAMSGVITGNAETAYDLSISAIKKLGETGKLLTDSAALEEFLTKIAESILQYAEEVGDTIQNPDPEKSGWAKNYFSKIKFNLEKMVAPTAWALRKAGIAETDTLAEDYFDYIQTLPTNHPHRLILQKLVPGAISMIEQMITDWIPTAAKVMHKLISWLFACIAIFQMVMSPEESEKLVTGTRDTDSNTSGQVLAAHRYLETELLLRNYIRRNYVVI